MVISVSQINIYPLKSAAPIELKQSIMTKRGLANDRRWMLVDMSGKALTAREFPSLLRVDSLITERSIVFSHSQDHLEVEMPGKANEKMTVRIFSASCPATDVSRMADKWFSDYLETDCHLVYMRDEDIRSVLAKSNGREGDIVSFADENPLLLISEASLIELNKRLDQPVTMKNFRPNLVVKGTSAFEEDNWDKIQIGRTEFRVAQACKRCNLTTIDPQTAQFRKDREPLKTLAKFRYDPDKNSVIFGVHLGPLSTSGQINISDSLAVL